MALEGYEWLTVLAVLLVVFLWGPNKLPELARSVALAKKEFEKAAKDVSATTTTATNPTPNTQADALIVAAKSLGIITQGKTKEEIVREIREVGTKK